MLGVFGNFVWEQADDDIGLVTIGDRSLGPSRVGVDPNGLFLCKRDIKTPVVATMGELRMCHGEKSRNRQLSNGFLFGHWDVSKGLEWRRGGPLEYRWRLLDSRNCAGRLG